MGATKMTPIERKHEPKKRNPPKQPKLFLTNEQRYRLYQAMESDAEKLETTRTPYDELARQYTATMGFEVRPSHIRSAVRDVGLKMLPRKVRRKKGGKRGPNKTGYGGALSNIRKQISTLAYTVGDLAGRLGEDDLKALAAEVAMLVHLPLSEAEGETDGQRTLPLEN